MYGFNEAFSIISFSSLPFNWKQPFGYAIALMMQCIQAYYSVMAGVVMSCYLIGSCFLLKSFINDITNDVSVLNFEAITSDGKYGLKIKHFINIVQEFSTVKELSR